MCPVRTETQSISVHNTTQSNLVMIKKVSTTIAPSLKLQDHVSFFHSCDLSWQRFLMDMLLSISGAAEVFFKLNSIMKSFCYASDNYAKVSAWRVTFSVTKNISVNQAWSIWMVLGPFHSPPAHTLLRLDSLVHSCFDILCTNNFNLEKCHGCRFLLCVIFRRTAGDIHRLASGMQGWFICKSRFFPLAWQ